MKISCDLILKGGTVVNHEGVGLRDVTIKSGKIENIGDASSYCSNKVVDCTGLHILPGVIDSQVHFREPGLEHKETLESGSRAAVLGGVTTVFEMPNTSPATTNAIRLEEKMQRAKGRMHCDFAFWVGATRENIDDLVDLENCAGVAGIKVFMGSSTGDLLVKEDTILFEILKKIKRRAAFHAEDETRLLTRKTKKREGDPSSHSVWRDSKSAFQATKRLSALAYKAKARIHILHVSTSEEVAFLADKKDYISCEITPHHLTLSDEDYSRFGSKIQMNPPIRSAQNRDALWQAVGNRIIDVLGSDHAPHSLEEKERPYPESPSGITGVQTLVPLMLNHVNARRLSLEHFVELTSYGPRRIFDLPTKGFLEKGFDADFTLVDLKKQKTITNSQQASKAGWTPYDGYKVTGWPIASIVRGKIVMWENEIITSGEGEPVLFSRKL